MTNTATQTDGAKRRADARVERMQDLLATLARRHRRNEQRLYRLSGRALRDASIALRRFWALRDALTLRLFAARSQTEGPCEKTLASLDRTWMRAMRASDLVDRHLGAPKS